MSPATGIGPAIALSAYVRPAELGIAVTNCEIELFGPYKRRGFNGVWPVHCLGDNREPER